LGLSRKSEPGKKHFPVRHASKKNLAKGPSIEGVLAEKAKPVGEQDHANDFYS
jgi:hypothetical protein